MPATISALFRNETPVRLRLWSALTVSAAALLLAALSLIMSSVQGQVRVIGREAAPQAATASDLYFALSDLDAQVTRILLAGDSDELAGSRVDALGAYRDRGHQVDRDLHQSLNAGAAEVDRVIVLRLMDGLAVYRQRVGQALAAGSATDALGYYTQAANLLHQRLLPDARALRDAGTARLDDAYVRKDATASLGVTLAVLLGGLLLALLIGLQIWLARRFRRTWNPALIVATVIGAVLPAAAILVLNVQSSHLSHGLERGLGPYLALSEMRALGYDAAADTGRYVISANLTYYRDDFTGKSACLTGDPACTTPRLDADGWAPDLSGDPVTDAASARGGLPRLTGADVLSRWDAYRTGHERILTLAAAGRTEEAVQRLTGIRRGDAAFDFAYFDASVSAVTDERKATFDQDLAAAERTLTGWVLLPIVLLAAVIALIPLSVRKRLEEYR
ncbi:hypothetical protein [Actinoplanes utahensis]|uniref:hypothetical protein n=1 Tax=Actinoplanes utahensis TaxID=1869 RepID=UPI001F1D6000|nr:hypothetical protein [Actinoplanes utahensis]